MNKNEIESKIKTIFEFTDGQIGMGQGLKNIEFINNDYILIESNHPMKARMITLLMKNLHESINADVITSFRKNTVLILKLNDI